MSNFSFPSALLSCSQQLQKLHSHRLKSLYYIEKKLGYVTQAFLFNLVILRSFNIISWKCIR